MKVDNSLNDKKLSSAKAPTIYDIAAKTGVSAAAVSQVLNNKGAVSPEVRKTILKTAKELNYMPNIAARSLKTKRTNNILLGINYYRDQFYFDLIKGVKEIVEANGYNLIITYTDDSVKKEIDLFERLTENIFDALILVTISNNTELIKRMKELKCPVTISAITNNCFDLADSKIDYVGVDTYKGIQFSTRHLIDQGYKHIGYVGVPVEQYEAHAERFEGYKKVMSDAGYPIEPEFVHTGGFSQEFGYEAGKKMIKNNSIPDAICCSTDIATLGLFKAFREAGIDIPKRVALVGMDNLDIDEMILPSLTSVDLKQYLIGKTAGEFVCSRLNGYSKQCRSIIYSPQLIIRESSVV